MKNTLESSKFFPIIAWTLVVGFAVFTYFLATNVQSELSNITTSVERLEEKIDTMGVKPENQELIVNEKNREAQ